MGEDKKEKRSSKDKKSKEKKAKESSPPASLRLGIIGQGQFGSALRRHVDPIVDVVQCGHVIAPEISSCEVIILAVPPITIPEILLKIPMTATIIDCSQPHKRTWESSILNAFFNVSAQQLRDGSCGTIFVHEASSGTQNWKVLRRIFPDLSFVRFTPVDYEDFKRRLRYPFHEFYVCLFMWVVLLLLVWAWCSWSRHHYFLAPLSDMACADLNKALGVVTIIFCSLPYIPAIILGFKALFTGKAWSYQDTPFWLKFFNDHKKQFGLIGFWGIIAHTILSLSMIYPWWGAMYLLHTDYIPFLGPGGGQTWNTTGGFFIVCGVLATVFFSMLAIASTPGFTSSLAATEFTHIFRRIGMLGLFFAFWHEFLLALAGVRSE